MSDKKSGPPAELARRAAGKPAAQKPGPAMHPKPFPKEIGGPEGPEPTRYGDWEKNGRCSDF
ncbi:MAG: succinate dehydrogenase assembly factor 4 [Dongiaceae bacterium]